MPLRQFSCWDNFSLSLLQPFLSNLGCLCCTQGRPLMFLWQIQLPLMTGGASEP